MKPFLKIIIPFSVWFFLFQPLLSGKVVISSETLHIYSVVKFYSDNLKLGVFPLWDPFVMWGEPTQIFLNYVGIFNPLWLVTFFLNICGLSFYQSFVCSISLYFWIGQWGFYLLAKIILKDRRAAYCAFLLFLLSSVSMSMFAQFHPQLLYIPATWFFYFLLSFLKNPSRLSWVGLTFAGAIILTSYLPFYFLTVLFIVLAVMAGVFFTTIGPVVTRIATFVRAQWALVMLSLGIIILAFLPGYYAYQSTVQQDIVAPFRNGSLEKAAGVDFVDYKKVVKNGLSSRMDLEDLYSNLDMIQYGDDCYFYVSLFFYCVLILGVGLRINKVLIVCGLTAIPLFLLMMTSATGFHRFIFEHVPYFKLIRNMHFFLPFFLAVMILLVAEQLRIFYEKRKVIAAQHRFVFFVAVVIVHASIVGFLLSQHNIIATSYGAVGLSFLFWLVFPARVSSVALPVLLFASIVIQPCEVIWRHNQGALKDPTYGPQSLIKECAQILSVKPVFVYTRAVSSREIGNDDTAYSRIAMRDATRFFGNGFPAFWSYRLSQKENFAAVQKYTAHKFYVYSHVDVLEDEDRSGKLHLVLSSGLDVALINPDDQSSSVGGLMVHSGRALIGQVAMIEGPSDTFQVVSFNVNAIKIRTQYSQEKFLVYTDSFHQGWKAFINGQAVKVYRANMAFKGIVLPAGGNDVELRYSPSKIAVMSMTLVVALFICFIYLLWLALRGRNVKNIS